MANTTSAYNKEMFDHKECWENYDEGDLVTGKIRLISEMIPGDVITIIDIGCGNGVITNALNKKYKTLGVDQSEEALRYLEGPKLISSAEKINVEDSSYDLVLSSELLEHLTEEILQSAVKEIKRISKKYILITVPNSENLDQNLVKCSKCQKLFHSYGHLRSFNEEMLIGLFGGGYKVVSGFQEGPWYRIYNNLLLRLRHKYGNQYFNPAHFTLCPFCGNTDFPLKKGNFISKMINGLNSIIARRVPYWFFILFEKVQR